MSCETYGTLVSTSRLLDDSFSHGHSVWRRVPEETRLAPGLTSADVRAAHVTRVEKQKPYNQKLEWRFNVMRSVNTRRRAAFCGLIGLTVALAAARVQAVVVGNEANDSSKEIPAQQGQNTAQNAGENTSTQEAPHKDWIFDQGLYTNNPKTGKRVWQYKKNDKAYRDPNALFDSPMGSFPFAPDPYFDGYPYYGFYGGPWYGEWYGEPWYGGPWTAPVGDYPYYTQDPNGK